MKLEFRPRALTDLREIQAYLLEHAGERAADRVREHLRQRLDRLRRRPLLGIATSHPTIRVLNPTKYPYRIYFATVGDAIVVLHIRHTSRRSPQFDNL